MAALFSNLTDLGPKHLPLDRLQIDSSSTLPYLPDEHHARDIKRGRGVLAFRDFSLTTHYLDIFRFYDSVYYSVLIRVINESLLIGQILILEKKKISWFNTKCAECYQVVSPKGGDSGKNGCPSNFFHISQTHVSCLFCQDFPCKMCLLVTLWKRIHFSCALIKYSSLRIYFR